MNWPVGVFYAGLDPDATYTVRITGQGDSPLRADGIRLVPTLYSKNIGEFKEFPVPASVIADGAVRLTWDEIDESHLNWRQHSHVAEIWLLEQPR